MKNSKETKLSIDKFRVASLTKMTSIIGGTGTGNTVTNTDTDGTQTNTLRPKSTGSPLCRPNTGNPTV